jgi:hypothetical protein
VAKVLITILGRKASATLPLAALEAA